MRPDPGLGTMQGGSSAPSWKDWLAVCGLRREAAIWGGLAVVGGGRSSLLEQRLEAAIAAGRPAGLISFGVCGALAEGLRVGDGLAARSVTAPDGQTWVCDPAALAELTSRTGAQTVETAGADAVAADLAVKRALAARCFAAVDMESHIAARAAAAHGLPLTVLRVVSDDAGHALPPAAVAGMGADGSVDVAAVLSALVRDPRQLPALLRTGRSAGTAFRRLREIRNRL